jgi:hypothetical protein
MCEMISHVPFVSYNIHTPFEPLREVVVLGCTNIQVVNSVIAQLEG